MRIKNPAIYVFLVSVMSGCAFNDVHLDMPINGLEHPISGGNDREVILGIPFSDTRKVTERCGVMKNGYNKVTADVICDTSPSLWISQLLADELRASKFRVLMPNDPHGDAALRIDGDIQKVFSEPIIGVWSSSIETDLKVKLIATANDGLHAERTFFGKGTKKGLILANRGAFHTSLIRVSEQVLAEMVEAIFYLMNKYPHLGKPNNKSQAISTQVIEDN